MEIHNVERIGVVTYGRVQRRVAAQVPTKLYVGGRQVIETVLAVVVCVSVVPGEKRFTSQYATAGPIFLGQTWFVLDPRTAQVWGVGHTNPLAFVMREIEIIARCGVGIIGDARADGNVLIWHTNETWTADA